MTDPALFHIAPGSAEPIYRQLMAQVRRCIAGGQLPPGAELPSVRELAHSLAVNPMTISKAYSLLEAEGVLERRRGLGMTVAARPPNPGGPPSPPGLPDKLALLRPTLARAADEAAQLQLGAAPALVLFKTLLQEREGR